MSESVLYRVYNKTVRGESEYQNGWLSAPLLWSYLAQKYLGRDVKMFGNDPELWGLVTDQKLPRHCRIALAMTLDRALCPSSRIAEVSGELLKVAAVLPDHSHWKVIADDMAQIKDKRMKGVGLTCTTVSDVWKDWQASKGEKEAWDIFEIFAKDSTDVIGGETS